MTPTLIRSLAPKTRLVESAVAPMANPAAVEFCMNRRRLIFIITPSTFRLTSDVLCRQDIQSKPRDYDKKKAASAGRLWSGRHHCPIRQPGAGGQRAGESCPDRL